MTITDRVVGHWRDSVYATVQEIRHIVRPSRVDRYAAGPRRPVLLLPGVYETWEFLRPAADRLNRLGHPIHIVPAFGYNRGSIPSMAALAQRYLDGRDLRDVVIVAHSKGGLIGKHMIVSDDTAGRIACLIAINTPFGGSRYARWAVRRTLREFSPTGVTVAALAAQGSANGKIVSIYSADDAIIPGGSELAGATNIRLPLIGHFRPLSSEVLLDTLERLLAEHPGR